MEPVLLWKLVKKLIKSIIYNNVKKKNGFIFPHFFFYYIF